MKTEQLKKDLNQMSVEQLQKKLTEFRRELFTLRLNALTAHVVNYAQFKQLRKNIARALTVLHAKEQEIKA